MTTNSRAAQRVPSRTPPFVLVGLLVVLSFLGYSYYSLSSSNGNLSTQLEAIRLEKRDTESKHSELEKTMTSVKSQVSALQIESNQLKRDSQVKDTEIQSLKADLAQKVADEEKQKSLMERCDEKLSVVQKDLESTNAEKSTLQHTLDAEREKTAFCSMEACQAPVQQILTIASKLVGSSKMQEALSQAQLDANKLMMRINFPVPADDKLKDKPELHRSSEKMLENNKINSALKVSNLSEPAKVNSFRMEQSIEADLGKSEAGNTQVIDLPNQKENSRASITFNQEARATGVFDKQVDEARHLGDDGNRSFPHDSVDHTQKETDNNRETVDPNLAFEEATDIGLYDGDNGFDMEKRSQEEQEGPGRHDSFVTQDKENLSLYDKSKQLDVSKDVMEAFRGDQHIASETGQAQGSPLKEVQETQVIPYKSLADNPQGFGEKSQNDFEGGENMVRHFKTQDIASEVVFQEHKEK